MKFKKKTQVLYQEAILIIVSLVIISLTLYFTLNYISGTKTTIEKSAPELTYKFPASFIHGFLYTKISNEDKKNLNLDETKTYYVKDLLPINSKESQIIVNKLRLDYIQEMNTLSKDSTGNMHAYYQSFSKSNYNEEDLLFIVYSLIEVPILEENFNEKNYFYYLKQNNNKYVIIYFLKTSSNKDLATFEIDLGSEAP